MPSVRTITIPNVELTLEQLITAIRQLEPEARTEVARALMETELDARMAEMLDSLAARLPADDISDAEIAAQVQAVRDQKRQPC